MKDAISYAQTEEIFKRIRHLEERSLLILIYLTGARVSEILGKRGQNFNKEKLPKLNCITYDSKNQTFIITITRSKSKRNKKRSVLISYSEEPYYFEAVLTWIEARRQQIRAKYKHRPAGDEWTDFEPLFKPQSYKRGVRIFEKHFGFLYHQNIHMLRHLRTTHLLRNFGYSIFQISKVLGWDNIQIPASTYAHYDLSEIQNKKLNRDI